MPTSGSHQLIKCIELLYHPANYWQDRVYVSPHSPCTKKNYEKFEQNKYKILLNIRDPRDRLISYAYTYHKVKNLKPVQSSIVDVSLRLITEYGTINCNYFHHYPKSFYKEISNFGDHYCYYIPWFNYPDLLVVRFENLIGPKGGGSLEAQYAEIRKIANFIGIPVTEQKIKYASDNLWGGTQSFRHPKIGLWKNYFTEKHYQKFNDIGMQEIGKSLGYSIE